MPAVAGQAPISAPLTTFMAESTTDSNDRGHMVRPVPTLFVMVGLPAAGKTTRARQLELERQALRLTPDEWMLPLLGDAEANGKRDVLEGRFVALARQALRGGLDVILDFGVWGRDERMALKSMAVDADANCEFVCLPVEPAEQRRRHNERLQEAPQSTCQITDNDFAQFAAMFEPLTDSELETSTITAPPSGFDSWAAWTAHRWPTSG